MVPRYYYLSFLPGESRIEVHAIRCDNNSVVGRIPPDHEKVSSALFDFILGGTNVKVDWSTLR